MTFLTALIALASALLVPVANTALAQRWASREITPRWAWSRVNPAAAIAGVAAFAATHPAGLGAAAASAAAAGMAVTVTATDLHCLKAPRELPHIVALAGLACALPAVITAPAATLITLAVTATAIVIIPWVARALTRNGLGFSDIRILWALTATLSWWTGFVPLIWALIGACLLQIVARVVVPARLLGRTHTLPSGKTRRELPFAPALTIAFVTAAIYCAHTGMSACVSLGTC